MRALVHALLVPVLGMSAVAADWPGRPKADPPSLQQKGPPPAWLETRLRSSWLAWGSYCWTTVCADMIPPSMRKDIPTVSVKRGTSVRVHLAFVPLKANIVLLQGERIRTLRLQPKRVLVWRPQVGGLALVDVHAGPGSAGYLIRIRL